MTLTARQQKALNNGEAVTLVVNGSECVLLLRDVYNRVKRAVDYDDSDWTEEEMRAIAARTFDEADNAEPIQ